MRRLVPFALLAVIAAAFWVGQDLRGRLPGDPSPAALQAWIVGLGWKGVAAFVAVMTFRQFLFVPSAIVLTVGGLCYGAVLGTLLGMAGIVLSAVLKFTLARRIGQGWMAPGAAGERQGFARRLERLGPAVIAGSTAHPLGPLSAFHWAAGLSAITPGVFLAAVALGAPVRAFAYALFGSALLDTHSPHFVAVSAVLTVVVLLPLLHPATRRAIFGGNGPLR
jgi:uncharacterized membrane protein YdjX (TVP38/TMEM64 family)